MNPATSRGRTPHRIAPYASIDDTRRQRNTKREDGLEIEATDEQRQ